jgi:hypothetical protein
MESNTPLLNTTFRTATGRSNIRARNMHIARKRGTNILNKYNKTMKGYYYRPNNNASTINGSNIESVYSNNISVNSVTSPVSYSPKSIDVINEEIQLGPGNLTRPNIPLAAIKYKTIKEWLKANPGEWKRITELWQQEKTNNNQLMPPSFVTAKVLERMGLQAGGFTRRINRKRRRTHRKSRRSNRK